MGDVATIIGKHIDSIPVREFVLGMVGAVPQAVEEDGLLSVELPRAGFEMTADSDTGLVHTVYLYGTKAEQGFAEFSGAVPHRVRFSLSRPEVLTLLGRDPDYFGPSYDSWDFPEYRLVVRYGKSGVSVVGLTTQR